MVFLEMQLTKHAYGILTNNDYPKCKEVETIPTKLIVMPLSSMNMQFKCTICKNIPLK